MLNLNLSSPLGRRHDLVNPPPAKTVQAQPTPAAESTLLPGPLLPHLTRNACDAPGCKKYGHTFASPQALADHKRAAHSRHHAPPLPPTPETLIIEAKAEPKRRQFQCKQCQHPPFEKFYELGRHTRDAHPKPPTIKPGKTYTCPHCAASFTDRFAYSAHCRYHHQQMETMPPPNQPHRIKLTKKYLASLPLAPAVCPECGISGTRKWLSSHWGRTHSTKPLIVGTDPFACPECGHTGFSKDSIWQHAKKAHNVSVVAVVRDATFIPQPLIPSPTPTPAAFKASHPEGNECFVRFSGSQLECAKASLLLIENGFTNLTTAKL